MPTWRKHSVCMQRAWICSLYIHILAWAHCLLLHATLRHYVSLTSVDVCMCGSFIPAVHSIDQVCLRMRRFIRTCMPTYLPTHACMHTSIRHSYTGTCVHIRTWPYMRTHVDAYIRTCVHTWCNAVILHTLYMLYIHPAHTYMHARTRTHTWCT